MAGFLEGDELINVHTGQRYSRDGDPSQFFLPTSPGAWEMYKFYHVLQTIGVGEIVEQPNGYWGFRTFRDRPN